MKNKKVFELRNVNIEVREDEKDDQEVFDLSFSSEEPYERIWGVEILDHNDGSIRMDRLNKGAAVMIDHISDQVGVVEKAFLDKESKKLRGQIRFSKSQKGREIRQDVIDGIRKNVSIGYVIHKVVLEEEKEGKEYYRVTDWEPLEVSVVSVPADSSVGFGRSQEAIKEMIKSIKEPKENEINKKTENKTETIKVNMMEQSELKREDVLKAERERLQEIESLESRHQLDLNEFKFGKKSDADISEVRGYVLSQIPQDKPLETSKHEVDLSAQEEKKYDIMKAIRYLLDPKRFANEAGLEIEASNDIAKRTGTTPRGIFIPFNVQKRIREKRDLTTGGSTSGSELVGTDHLGGSLIELLRNKMLVTRMGARYLSGLVGDVSIPRWDGAATAGWVSTEGAGTSESTPTTGSLSMSPKEVSAYVEYSRQMALQSSPDVGMLVEDDLMQVLALAIDHAAYHGGGSSGEPQGIVGTSGVGAVALASATWAKIVEFESDVDTGNALDGTLNYVTTPSIRGTLKSRAKESGYPVYIVSENNSANGYPIWSTGQIDSGYMIFGNFAQLLIGEWGGLDLVVDQSASTGKFGIGAFKTVDIGVRQPGAFSVGSSFS